MMLKPVRITAPSAALLELAETKAFCNVDHSDDDDLISSLIGAATSYLDGYSGIMGRCLINQEWHHHQAGFSSVIRLPFPDVSAGAVSCLQSDGNYSAVPDSAFSIMQDALGAYVSFDADYSFPAHEVADGAVRVFMVAGYGSDAASVPETIRTAAKMLVSHWYENRGLAMMSAFPASFHTWLRRFA